MATPLPGPFDDEDARDRYVARRAPDHVRLWSRVAAVGYGLATVGIGITLVHKHAPDMHWALYRGLIIAGGALVLVASLGRLVTRVLAPMATGKRLERAIERAVKDMGADWSTPPVRRRDGFELTFAADGLRLGWSSPVPLGWTPGAEGGWSPVARLRVDAAALAEVGRALAAFAARREVTAVELGPRGLTVALGRDVQTPEVVAVGEALLALGRAIRAMPLDTRSPAEVLADLVEDEAEPVSERVGALRRLVAHGGRRANAVLRACLDDASLQLARTAAELLDEPAARAHVEARERTGQGRVSLAPTGDGQLALSDDAISSAGPGSTSRLD